MTCPGRHDVAFPTCDCEVGRATRREYKREVRRRARGISNTDYERAQANLEELLRRGWPPATIAAQAGLDQEVGWRMGAILRSGRQFVIRDDRTVRAIGAIDPTVIPRGRHLVPAVGATRRVRALALLGHSRGDVAIASGVSTRILSKLRAGEPYVYGATWWAMREVTRQLGSRLGKSARAREDALKQGWRGLGEWDDIDDPDEVPSSGPRGLSSSRSIMVAEAAWLLGLGESPEQVSLRLACSLSGLAKACNAQGRHDIGLIFEKAYGRARRAHDEESRSA